MLLQTTRRSRFCSMLDAPGRPEFPRNRGELSLLGHPPRSHNPCFDARLSDHLATIFVCFSKSGAGEKRVLCVMSAMNSRRSIGSRALLNLACVCAISTSTVAQARLPLGRV